MGGFMGNTQTTLFVQYDKISSISAENLKGIFTITILFDETDANSILGSLLVNKDGSFSRVEKYDSLKEFSTVAMKELLTLYAKRTIIASDTEYYKKDDPKLHSFISKLSYPGIEAVCKQLDVFSDQFKAGNVTTALNLKLTNKLYKKH